MACRKRFLAFTQPPFVHVHQVLYLDATYDKNFTKVQATVVWFGVAFLGNFGMWYLAVGRRWVQ